MKPKCPHCNYPLTLKYRCIDSPHWCEKCRREYELIITVKELESKEKNDCLGCKHPNQGFTPEQVAGFCLNCRQKWLKKLNQAFKDTRNNTSDKFTC